jgi:hypothetical protein
MDVHKGRISRTIFQKGTTKQKEYWNSFIQTCVSQCHHPLLMGIYTMYHSLMIILVKDLDIFEVFNKIKEFKALIENLFVRKIKILRLDNRGEYMSKEFLNLYKDVGINIPNKTI